MKLNELPKRMLKQCITFTSVSSASSRVWPALVQVSLAQNAALSIPLPDGPSSSESRSKPAIKLESTRKFLFKCSKESLADICWVTGGIIVVTGLFVAAFGIFPRNQVS